MKITIYTITDCQFSKQEKEYLSSHGLQFEEKNLEMNKEFLTEMLAVGNNFAGTPVTKVEKDDGKIEVLKGFTPAEFDKTLGFGSTPVVEPVKPSLEDKPPEPAKEVEPAQMQPEVPVGETVPPVVQAPVEQPVVTTPLTTDPAMASLLNNLEQQAQVTTPVVPAAQAPVAPPVAPAVGTPPVIPDPQF